MAPTNYSSKRPQGHTNPSLEQQLPSELLLQILEKLVDHEEKAYGNLRASCTKLFQLSNEKEILTRMDLSKLLLRTSTMNADGRRFLQRFVELQIEEAALMLGTDLFFHEGKTEEGLMLLQKAAASQKKQCIYNYAIALMQVNSPDTYDTFQPLLTLEDNKATIWTCRNIFKEMVRSESLVTVTGRERCPRTGDSHWDKWWMSVHGDAELDIKCHFCCMDIEIFKLKRGT